VSNDTRVLTLENLRRIQIVKGFPGTVGSRMRAIIDVEIASSGASVVVPLGRQRSGIERKSFI
jgi:hypothetical protein